MLKINNTSFFSLHDAFDIQLGGILFENIINDFKSTGKYTENFPNEQIECSMEKQFEFSSKNRKYVNYSKLIGLFST